MQYGNKNKEEKKENRAAQYDDEEYDNEKEEETKETQASQQKSV